jgi:hypothetical protein
MNRLTGLTLGRVWHCRFRVPWLFGPVCGGFFLLVVVVLIIATSAGSGSTGADVPPVSGGRGRIRRRPQRHCRRHNRPGHRCRMGTG